MEAFNSLHVMIIFQKKTSIILKNKTLSLNAYLKAIQIVFLPPVPP